MEDFDKMDDMVLAKMDDMVLAKIVDKAWMGACLKAGKLVSWSDYIIC